MSAHFGATLRLLRQESGLGLRDLARRLGVSSTYLSRVENGVDPAPTPARLEHLARELGLPATLLMELAQRVSPFLEDYLQRVPEAGPLFMELAHRDLDSAQLAEVRAYLDARFPLRPAKRPLSLPPVSDLLAPERVVLRLRCVSLDDALEVAGGRLSMNTRPSSPVTLAEVLKEREKEVSSAIGGGVAVPSAYLEGAPESAALITLATPLRHPTPDGQPLRVLVAWLGPWGGPNRRIRLAQIARLGTLAEALSGIESPQDAIAKLSLLELRR